jgi:peptidoglycan/xylan/chitin deacetylase (PgdA/CDA1 family)
MRNYVIAGLCLVGGIAWAVSLSFTLTAKPTVGITQPAAPAVTDPAVAVEPAAKAPVVLSVAEPAAKPGETVIHFIEAETKTGEQITAEIEAAAATKTVEQTAKQADMPAIDAETKSGEQITAEIEAATETKRVSGGRLIVQASLEPTVKADAITPAPLDQPEAKPAAASAPMPAALAPQAGCPGNPDAIGTSRVLTISAKEYSLLGTMQYKQTLPLKDREVVLTFDDGPIPPYTNSILDTLAANCVKATYFLVGEMAHARPYLVRRIYNEGHSIGTHTQNHPFGFEHLPIERVARQVNGGIASVDAALGDSKALSPFFRIPGLGRTTAIEHFLESEGLITWSADIDTNDWWRGSSPGSIVKRAMQRLNARGRGIILMHDIHPATALALPGLLKELKANGYHIVQVVAAGERPKTLPEAVASTVEKEAWPRLLHVNAENGGPAKARLRHRVKVALAHHRHRRSAERQEVGRVDYSTTSSINPHSTRSY